MPPGHFVRDLAIRLIVRLLHHQCYGKKGLGDGIDVFAVVSKLSKYEGTCLVGLASSRLSSNRD